MKIETILNKILIIAILVLIIIFGIYVGYSSITTKNNNCLKEIANNYCEENNLFFDKIIWNFSPVFFCKENERKFQSERYEFLDEELEKCK